VGLEYSAWTLSCRFVAYTVGHEAR
jgi:hypothetical protein